MLRSLLSDEAGFVISAELVLVSTILVIGLIVGLSEVQHAVVSELNDVADAIGEINQSYCYSGFHKIDYRQNIHAATYGSNFIDMMDDCDRNQCDIACDAPVDELPKGGFGYSGGAGYFGGYGGGSFSGGGSVSGGSSASVGGVAVGGGSAVISGQSASVSSGSISVGTVNGGAVSTGSYSGSAHGTTTTIEGPAPTPCEGQLPGQIGVPCEGTAPLAAPTVIEAPLAPQPSTH